MDRGTKLKCPNCGNETFIRELKVIDEIMIYKKDNDYSDWWVDNIETKVLGIRCKNCNKEVNNEDLQVVD